MDQAELEDRVEELRKALVGQMAMNTMLLKLLVDRNVITTQDGILVVMAGEDSKQFRGLTPKQVLEYARSVLGR